MEIAEQIQPQKMGKLFKSDNQYTIPSYQRRYSWGDKQVQELWQNLRNIENKTDFEMAHELVDKSTWDVDAIEQRSERLAKIAVHIWSS